MSDINETLKQKIDEWDLDRRLNAVVAQAETALQRGVGLAGDYAHEHRDDVDRALDKVTAAIADRTQGRYTDKVDQVRDQVERGLGRLAERRQGDA